MIPKKISLCLCLLLVLSLLFCSCGGDTEEPEDTNEGPVTHTVTFDSQGGTPVPSIFVIHGSAISEPPKPTRENSVFDGWYLGNVKWDFTRSVREDTTLVARWSDPSATFEYKINSETNEAAVVAIKGSITTSELIIPSTYKGFPVTAIGDEVFKNNLAGIVQKIFLPSTIKSVGADAFSGCENIHIDLSTAVLTEVGEFAFANCNLLGDVLLGEGLTELPAYAFMNCSSLTFVYLPSTLTRIDESVFDGCETLSTILIPSSVEEIGHGAFSDCDSLSTLFFGGTQEEFDLLMTRTNQSFNKPLLDLKEEVILYSETEPSGEGNYWHYDDTHTPKLW